MSRMSEYSVNMASAACRAEFYSEFSDDASGKARRVLIWHIHPVRVVPSIYSFVTILVRSFKPMLNWNSGKVRNLTGAEIWLFIIGRGLAAFGVGVLSVRYYPPIAEPLGLPAIVIGLLLLLVAAKGMFRRSRPS